MVNYGNVINQISPSISKSLGKKGACHLKIVAFKNCVWRLWNCFMDLEFVVSLRILGFMERNLCLRVLMTKTVKHNQYVTLLPCTSQSTLRLLSSIWPYSLYATPCRPEMMEFLLNVTLIPIVFLDVFEFNIYPIIGTVFLWENAFYLCICVCTVYVYIVCYFVYVCAEKMGWPDQCVETCIPHTVNIVQV